MASDQFNGAAAPTEEINLADRFDHTQLSVALSMAMRLQADTLKPGDQLHVSLPGTDEVVDLDVLQVGKIDPDILSPDEMVDPATQDSPAMPGALVDISPLYGDEPNNFLALTLDPEEMMPAATRDKLAEYGVNAVDAAQYGALAAENGGQVQKMNLQWSHGGEPPEVLPATAAEFESVGMKAAAQALGQAAGPAPEAPKIEGPGVSGP